MDEQFWSALIGAVVGALVSGVITYVLQNQNFRHERKLETSANDRRDLAAATSMLLKSARMFSTIGHIDAHIARAKARLAEASLSWQMLQPIIGKTPEINFSDEERTFIVVNLPSEFVAVLEMPDIHNDLIHLVEEYARQRLELASLMPAISKNDMLATTNLTQEDHERLTPRMLNLQSLLDNMIEHGGRARGDSIAVFNLIKAVGTRRFGAAFPKLELDLQAAAGGNG